MNQKYLFPICFLLFVMVISGCISQIPTKDTNNISTNNTTTVIIHSCIEKLKEEHPNYDWSSGEPYHSEFYNMPIYSSYCKYLNFIEDKSLDNFINDTCYRYDCHSIIDYAQPNNTRDNCIKIYDKIGTKTIDTNYFAKEYFKVGGRPCVISLCNPNPKYASTYYCSEKKCMIKNDNVGFCILFNSTITSDKILAFANEEKNISNQLYWTYEEGEEK